MSALEGQGPGVRFRSIAAFLGACLAVALTAYGAVPILFAGRMLKYPIDYFPGEGDFLFLAHRMLRGENIYADSSALPLLGNVYPPLYPWIMWFAARIFGPELSTMRMLSLAPALGLPVLVYFLSNRLGARPWLAFMAAAAVPAMFSLSIHLVNPRCDGWAVLFTFGALCFFAAPGINRTRACLGACCAALALYCKQTALFGVVALLLHLAFANRRLGILAIAAFFLANVALAGAALLQFGGLFFHSILLLSAHREFEAGRFFTQIAPVFAALPVLFAAAFVRMVAGLIRKRWNWVDTYVAGQLAVVALMLFDGSGDNYFLPLLPGACVSAALGAESLLAWDRGRLRMAAALALVAALQLVLQFPKMDALTVPSQRHWTEAQAAADFLTSASDPVYAERCWGPVAGAPATDRFFVEPIHIRMLESKREAMQAVERAFDERRFARVLVYREGYHWPEFGQVVERNYRLVRIGTLRVSFGEARMLYLVPQSDDAPPSPRR